MENIIDILIGICRKKGEIVPRNVSHQNSSIKYDRLGAGTHTPYMFLLNNPRGTNITSGTALMNIKI
jgi:hypothetical protein